MQWSFRVKKPVQIKPENGPEIKARLDDVNGRATSFTVSTFAAVAEIAQLAEERIKVLTVSSRPGVRATYTPAGPWARAYRYASASTRLCLERRRSGWVLTDVQRTEVYARTPKKLLLSVTPKQAAEITRRALQSVTGSK